MENAINVMGMEWVRWSGKSRLGMPRKHRLLSHYHFHQMPNIKYVFTFVRHPVGYYESLWKWLFDAGKTGRKWISGRKARGNEGVLVWHPKREPARLWSADFSVWVENMIEYQPCYVTRLYEQYCGPVGGEFCNFIGRMETLELDFIKVMNMVGYDTKSSVDGIREIGKINVAPDLDAEWESDLVEKVARTERLAVDRFYSLETADRRIYLDMEGQSVCYEDSKSVSEIG